MTAPETLSPHECWRLLGHSRLGRIATHCEGGIDIFPINFVAVQEKILFRSAPGSKLMNIAANPVVAFETDGRRAGRRWSVVIKGTAHRLDSDDEIQGSGIVGLHTDTSPEKWNYVRIVPTSITGRRI